MRELEQIVLNPPSKCTKTLVVNKGIDPSFILREKVPFIFLPRIDIAQKN